MSDYAQTSIQLYNQLFREGYSSKEIVCVRDAYELAMCLFTGLFRPSGKTFIDHSVGSAGILGSLHAPAAVVAAGLLHAAYVHGDFGTSGYGISDAKRKQVKRAVGETVEEYVARYTALLWDRKTIPVIHDSLDGLDSMGREVLLMRLANALEDHLDLGVLYCSNARVRQQSAAEVRGPIMVDMANKLGFPILAAELARVFHETTASEIPVELSISNQHHPYVIAPESYRKQLRIAFYDGIARGLHSFYSTFGMEKKIRRPVRGRHGRLRYFMSRRG